MMLVLESYFYNKKKRKEKRKNERALHNLLIFRSQNYFVDAWPNRKDISLEHPKTSSSRDSGRYMCREKNKEEIKTGKRK